MRTKLEQHVGHLRVHKRSSGSADKSIKCRSDVRMFGRQLDEASHNVVRLWCVLQAKLCDVAHQRTSLNNVAHTLSFGSLQTKQLLCCSFAFTRLRSLSSFLFSLSNRCVGLSSLVILSTARHITLKDKPHRAMIEPSTQANADSTPRSASCNRTDQWSQCPGPTLWDSSLPC